MISLAPFVAEYLASFFFVSVIFNSGGNPFIIGGALTLAIFYIGNISGGHVNPAVSLAMLFDGQLELSQYGGYVFAQLLGALSAVLLNRAIKK